MQTGYFLAVVDRLKKIMIDQKYTNTMLEALCKKELGEQGLSKLIAEFSAQKLHDVLPSLDKEQL